MHRGTVPGHRGASPGDCPGHRGGGGRSHRSPTWSRGALSPAAGAPGSDMAGPGAVGAASAAHWDRSACQSHPGEPHRPRDGQHRSTPRQGPRSAPPRPGPPPPVPPPRADPAHSGMGNTPHPTPGVSVRLPVALSPGTGRGAPGPCRHPVPGAVPTVALVPVGAGSVTVGTAPGTGRRHGPGGPWGILMALPWDPIPGSPVPR